MNGTAQKNVLSLNLSLLSLRMSSRARKALDDELQKVEFETSEEVDVVPTFDSMGIREDLLRGIYAYGFEKPSAIQQRAIKQIIKVTSILFLDVKRF